MVYQRLVSILQRRFFFWGGLQVVFFVYYGNDGMGPNEVGEQSMLMVTAINVFIHKDMIYKGFVVPAQVVCITGYKKGTISWNLIYHPCICCVHALP